MSLELWAKLKRYGVESKGDVLREAIKMGIVTNADTAIASYDTCKAVLARFESAEVPKTVKRMTRLEKVARSIFEARFGGKTAPSGLTFDQLVTETRNNYLCMAKASVEATLEIERQLVLGRLELEMED